MNQNGNLGNIVEALLFASQNPLPLEKLSSIVAESEESVKQVIENLNQKYTEGKTSFRIRPVSGGYQMYTLPEYAPWIENLLAIRKSQRLTKAALESLAIIAYRQPITKVEIEYIRGVQSDGVIHTLLERKLVTIVGREKTVGRPLLYGTTDDFLLYFGLKSLEDLPKVEELEALMKSGPDVKPLVSLEEISELNLEEPRVAIQLPEDSKV